MSKTKNHLVYQFKITLYEIEPCIWRRIQVPVKYSFWDFHVAIQDTMGWLDYHPYKPDEFNPDKVRFDNPKQRWKYAFSQD